MCIFKATGLTGVPATVAFVLCGPRYPTWWRYGQRPLRTATSGQDPTTGLLYYLEAIQRKGSKHTCHICVIKETVEGRCYSLTCWLHPVPGGSTTGSPTKHRQRQSGVFKKTHIFFFFNMSIVFRSVYSTLTKKLLIVSGDNYLLSCLPES